MKSTSFSSTPTSESQVSKTHTLSIMTRARTLIEAHDLGVVIGLTILCLLTRLMAIPASLWEWDDILFARALHRYDIVTHSPHPPGFPVFVAMSRIVFATLKDEHMALACVGVLFASLLGAALYYFYREVLKDRLIAIAGAILGIFAPNIWIHSGAARSDIPALTLGIIGLTLAIHGLRSRRSLILSCVVFGLGIGVRITVLPVIAPMLTLVLLAWLWRRRWRLVMLALAVVLVCILCGYVPIILHTTWPVYQKLFSGHANYTYTVDSIFSLTENGILSYRLRRFFLDVWGADWIMLTIYVFSALGLFALTLQRRWHSIWLMALSFLPFMIFVLIHNTPFMAPLYSLPYIPLFIGMAACGLVLTPRLLFGEGRWQSFAGFALTVGLTLGIVEWCYPITKLIHNEQSPSARAMLHLQKTLDAERDVLYYDLIFHPHALFYLSRFRTLPRREGLEGETNLIAPNVTISRVYGLTEEPVGADKSEFRWTPGRGERRLRPLSLGRYFRAYVSDLTDTQSVKFLSGWYQEEQEGEQSWRWMGRRGEVALLNRAKHMTLRLRGAVIAGPERARPTVTLRLDGEEIDKFTSTGNGFERTIDVQPNPSRLWSTLVIETSDTVTPSHIGLNTDDRELGLQCFTLRWSPRPSAASTIRSSDQFLGTGWYGVENENGETWRWTNGPAIAHLPPLEGDARLDIRLQVPEQSDGTRAEVRITFNGRLLDSFRPSGGILIKSYSIPPSLHYKAQAELTLSASSPAVIPDGRRAELQIFHLGWQPDYSK